MDKYTKFILTMIAVGIIGLNYHLFSGDIISKVEASHTGSRTYMDNSMRLHTVIDNWPTSITCK